LSIAARQRGRADWHANEEGPIAALARQYHASTRTVRAAIKHDAAWWEASIAEEMKRHRAVAAPPREYQVLGLVHYSGTGGKPGYQLKNAAGEPVAMVEGTIDDVLGHLAAEGWDVIQLIPGGGGWSDVVVGRSVN
jgi:hypothetical protein